MYRAHIAVLADPVPYPLRIGGLEKHTNLLVRYLAQAGAKVWLIMAGSDSETSLLKQNDFSHENIHIINVKRRDWSFPGGYLLSEVIHAKDMAKVLHKLAREVPALIAYAEGFSGMFVSFVPLISNLHGLESFQAYSRSWKEKIMAPVFRNISRRIFARSDVIVCLGKYFVELLREEIPPDKEVIVIPEPIDPEIIRDEVSGDLTQYSNLRIIFIGRNEFRKNLKTLIQCFNTVRDANPHIHLTLMGPFSHHYQNIPGVTIHPPATSPSSLFRVLDNHHIMIIPSKAEGMPLAMLEGMARGLAIAATPVGAIPEVVDDSIGWLAEGTSPGDILLLLKKIVETPPE